jgi:hypothetical protein
LVEEFKDCVLQDLRTHLEDKTVKTREETSVISNTYTSNNFTSRQSIDKKLMSQGFQLSCLQAAFRKLYGRYNNLIYPYNISLDHMLSDMFLTKKLA